MSNPTEGKTDEELGLARTVTCDRCGRRTDEELTPDPEGSGCEWCAECASAVATEREERSGASATSGPVEDDDPDEHRVRTAVMRLVFPAGTREDAEFDMDRALRKVREHAEVVVDELRLATDQEARRVRR